MVTALLLKASFPCSNSLDCPFPHVKHCPLHHIRVNLGNLPGDIGLQLVEGGRAWAVDLGLEEAPESEVEGEARSIPYRRSVRSCSHTIPKKVRNSRPINMGFKGWE